jgi:DNA-binding transcriptional ArsR family regulator
VARNRTKKAASKRLESADMDARLVKALRHPIRARALSILNDGVASPKMIAAELDVPLGTVGHHVKQLEALGCIELVETVPRRGALEHFYRGVVRSFLDDESWAILKPDTKTALSIELLKLINKNARDALVANTFDARDDRHLSRSPVTVDEQGWRELMSLLEQTMHEVARIHDDSTSRAAAGESVGDRFRATVALLGFESPATEPESPAT